MKREDQPMPPSLRSEVDRKSPEERRACEQVWRLLGQAERSPTGVLSDEEAWAELLERTAAHPEPLAAAHRRRDRTPVRHRRRLRRGGLVLIGLAAVLLFAAGLWRQPVTVTAPPGAYAAVELPDGSSVELNSGTRLRYRRSFAVLPFVPARARTVALEGEAFFRIARDGRPFRVETFNARIEVLGTAFNVWARQEQAAGRETRVTLSEGRVRVAAEGDPARALVLDEAGAAARVRNEADTPLAPYPVQPVPLEYTLAWRTRGFAAVDQPLSAVLNEVARRYAVSIETQNGLALTDTMVLRYQSEVTAETILRDLCLEQDCRYRKTSRGFALFPGD